MIFKLPENKKKNKEIWKIEISSKNLIIKDFNIQNSKKPYQ